MNKLRGMTEEQKEKLLLANMEKQKRIKETREKDLVSVGGWVVFRVDDYNLALVKKSCREDSDKYLYYPTLTSAISMLFEKHLETKLASQTAFNAKQLLAMVEETKREMRVVMKMQEGIL